MNSRTKSSSIDWLLPISLVFFALFLDTTSGKLKNRSIKPCTAGYGVLEATDDLLEMEDNQGCNFLKAEVPFIGNTCIKLLEQGPCRRGEWLIIDDDTEMLKCERRKCKRGRVVFKNRCVSLNNKKQCEESFELFITVHGKGKCECSPGYLHYPDTDKCYVPYTQGPCGAGKIIKMKIDDNTGRGVCEFNPCPRDEMTPLDRHCLPRDDTSHAKCYTIGKRRPCRRGSYLLIEPSLARPYCIGQKPNSILPRTARMACQLGHTRQCVRACDGPDYYAFAGWCQENYVYMFNYGRPVCFRVRCRRTSF